MARGCGPSEQPQLARGSGLGVEVVGAFHGKQDDWSPTNPQTLPIRTARPGTGGGRAYGHLPGLAPNRSATWNEIPDQEDRSLNCRIGAGLLVRRPLGEKVVSTGRDYLFGGSTGGSAS
jgi:hypothetical protein